MTGSVWIASYVMLWVAVIVLSLAVLALLRQVGVLHARVRPLGVHFAGEGLTAGTTAPHAETFDYTNSRLTVLAFTSADCSVCKLLVPALGPLQRQYRDLSLHRVDSSPSTRAIFDDFNVRSTPYFIAIDGEGAVALGGVANTIEQVEVMIEEALAPVAAANSPERQG